MSNLRKVTIRALMLGPLAILGLIHYAVLDPAMREHSETAGNLSAALWFIWAFAFSVAALLRLDADNKP